MATGGLSFLSSQISLIYKGATDPEAWKEILEAVSVWFGATKSALFTPVTGRLVGGFSYVYGWTQEDLDENFRDFPGEDVWVSRIRANGLIACEGATFQLYV